MLRIFKDENIFIWQTYFRKQEIVKAFKLLGNKMRPVNRLLRESPDSDSDPYDDYLNINKYSFLRLYQSLK